MAFKRKRSSPSTGRRVRRRTARKPRVTRGVSRMSHFALVQKRFDANWAYASGATSGFWRYQTFTAAGISDWSEFRNVFDEYKINGIKVEFRPRYDGVDIAAVTGSNLLGTTHVIVDPASAVTPTGVPGPGSLNYFLQQAQTVKSYASDKVFSYYVKPKIETQVFGGGLAGQLKYAGWLKCDGAENVVHRGAHVYIQPYNNNILLGNIGYDMFVTYYMQFRGNR